MQYAKIKKYYRSIIGFIYPKNLKYVIYSSIPYVVNVFTDFPPTQLLPEQVVTFSRTHKYFLFERKCNQTDNMSQIHNITPNILIKHTKKKFTTISCDILSVLLELKQNYCKIKNAAL